MSNIENIEVPIIQKKSPFQEAMDRLDLQGILTLQAFLSQKALEICLTEKQKKTAIHATAI